MGYSQLQPTDLPRKSIEVFHSTSRISRRISTKRDRLILTDCRVRRRKTSIGIFGDVRDYRYGERLLDDAIWEFKPGRLCCYVARRTGCCEACWNGTYNDIEVSTKAFVWHLADSRMLALSKMLNDDDDMWDTQQKKGDVPFVAFTAAIFEGHCEQLDTS